MQPGGPGDPVRLARTPVERPAPERGVGVGVRVGVDQILCAQSQPAQPRSPEVDQLEVASRKEHAAHVPVQAERVTS